MELEGWMASWGRWAPVFIFLGHAAVLDVKTMEISLPATALMGGAGAVYAFVSGHHTLLTFLMSALPGLIMLVVGLLSGGRAGMGDALTMLACSGFLLGNESLALLTAGAFAAAFFSGILLIRGHRGDTQIPFVPFLLVGAIAALTLTKLC